MTTSKRSRPSWLLIVLTVMLVLVAGACAGAAGAPPFEGGAIGGGEDSGGGTIGSAPQPAVEVPGSITDEDSGGEAVAQRDDALIVRTGSLSIEVEDFDAALARARTAVVGLGGYISGSQMAVDGDRPYASITYRIPADRWDEALLALKDLGDKTLSEQTQAVEVTSAVVDLDARIENLEATERSLQAIMVQATRIPDILEVQAQLTSVRGQIEQLTAEKNHLEQQAAYGTLTVGWSVPNVAVAAAQGSWDPAVIIDAALAQLVELGQGVLTVGIWLGIVGLPLLVVALVVIGIVVLVARRLGVGRRPAAPTEANVTNV